MRLSVSSHFQQSFFLFSISSLHRDDGLQYTLATHSHCFAGSHHCRRFNLIFTLCARLLAQLVRKRVTTHSHANIISTPRRSWTLSAKTANLKLQNESPTPPWRSSPKRADNMFRTIFSISRRGQGKTPTPQTEPPNCGSLAPIRESHHRHTFVSGNFEAGSDDIRCHHSGTECCKCDLCVQCLETRLYNLQFVVHCFCNPQRCKLGRPIRTPHARHNGETRRRYLHHSLVDKRDHICRG